MMKTSISNNRVSRLNYIYFTSCCYYYICVLSRSSRTEVFFKKVFLNISQNSQESTCNGVSFLSAASNFIKKETPAHEFSCEICKIFKNILFYGPPLMAASFCNKIQNIGINKFPATFVHNIFKFRSKTLW